MTVQLLDPHFGSEDQRHFGLGHVPAPSADPRPDGRKGSAESAGAAPVARTSGTPETSRARAMCPADPRSTATLTVQSVPAPARPLPRTATPPTGTPVAAEP